MRSLSRSAAAAMCASAFFFLLLLSRAGAAAPCERPAQAFPPVPTVSDLGLTAGETKALLSGEVVVKTVQRTPEDRMARALRLLDASPVELFAVASDSSLQREMFPELVEFEEIAACADGKLFRAVANVSWMLPSFHYTNRSLYNESGTSMTWTQVEGDFQKNDGNWAFFWHPASGRTLAVLTFDLAMRGILSLVPESFILYLTKHNLPRTVDRVLWMVGEVRRRDPARAAAWSRGWAELKPRLEAGELSDAKPWLSEERGDAGSAGGFRSPWGGGPAGEPDEVARSGGDE